MNFGWFTDQTDDGEVMRTTLHEFGHAIGCVHEQASPAAAGVINWNKPVVYAYYLRSMGWDQARVDSQVLYVNPQAGFSNTLLNPLSIMLVCLACRMMPY
jgi:hypothetical protein